MSEILVSNIAVTDNATGQAVAGITAATGALDQNKLAVTGQGQGLSKTGTYTITGNVRGGTISYDLCKWTSSDGKYDQFTVSDSSD